MIDADFIHRLTLIAEDLADNARTRYERRQGRRILDLIDDLSPTDNQKTILALGFLLQLAAERVPEEDKKFTLDLIRSYGGDVLDSKEISMNYIPERS